MTHPKDIVLSPWNVRFHWVVALHQRQDAATWTRVRAFALDGRHRENFNHSGFGTRNKRFTQCARTYLGQTAGLYYLCYLCLLRWSEALSWHLRLVTFCYLCHLYSLRWSAALSCYLMLRMLMSPYATYWVINTSGWKMDTLIRLWTSVLLVLFSINNVELSIRPLDFSVLWPISFEFDLSTSVPLHRHPSRWKEQNRVPSTPCRYLGWMVPFRYWVRSLLVIRERSIRDRDRPNYCVTYSIIAFGHFSYLSRNSLPYYASALYFEITLRFHEFVNY